MIPRPRRYEEEMTEHQMALVVSALCNWLAPRCRVITVDGHVRFVVDITPFPNPTSKRFARTMQTLPPRSPSGTMTA